MFDEKTITFIGAGNMGSAIIAGMLDKKIVTPEQIIAADPNEQAGADLVRQFGIRHTTDNIEAAEAADVLVLAVKPQHLDSALHAVRGRVDTLPLVVSIVAGVRIRDIAEDLHNSRIVRAMPNTPAQIGQGITAWTATYEVEDEQRAEARAILGALGEQIYFDDEHYLDMATALSGSGPAYVFLFIEAMIDAGVRMGLSRPQAEKLVLHTIRGSVEYAVQSETHPTILRNQVTSPGGTTAAGLFELERNGLRTAVGEAVWAAFQRSIELGERED